MLETGRFMFVNGDIPGAILFTETISVTPNTLYIFTGWGLNLLNIPGTLPRFAIKVIASLNKATVSIVKSAQPTSVDLSGEITYTLTLTNIGNVPANNVTIFDQIPPGTTFVENSVVGANGTPPILTLTSPIAPGGIAVVSFKVQVGNEIPNPNPIINTAGALYTYTIDPNFPNGGSEQTISNPAATVVSSAIITTTKSVDKAVADIGDILTYTITVTNSGSVSANNVTLTDNLASGATLVPGSITGATGSFPTLTLTSPVPAGQSNIVTYKVKTTATSINSTPILNSAVANFSYTVDANKPNGVSGTSNSNIVSTDIKSAIINMTKAVDKEISYIGEEITYNIALTNNGNTAANNVKITDILSSGLALVPDSLVVSVPSSGTPPSVITLTNSVLPKETVSITFKAILTDMPNPNPITNKASATFSYTVDPENPNGSIGNSSTNTVTTLIFRNHYSQQLFDIIQSVALEEAAIASLINSEGAKIQRMVAMQNVSTTELLCLNKSVSETIASINILESVLKQKLSVVGCQLNGSC